VREDDVLGPHGAERADESADDVFYAEPRMVAHLDEWAIAETMDFYRVLLAPLPPAAHVLDLMSSRYSHVPDDVPLGEVVGLGLNAEELAENRQLTRWVIHDLNREPRLPFADGSFDAVLNTVSVQYLTRPVAVFRDVARVLKPRAPLAVLFSDRMFQTKAIRAWRERGNQQRQELVRAYFAATGAFEDIEVTVRQGRKLRALWSGHGDPLFAVTGRRRVNWPAD
jgi:SAM-dependent methyltransferase